MLRQCLKPLVLSTLFLSFLAYAPAANSADTPSTKIVRIKPAKIAGKWRIAWDVRFGTVRGILDLKQNADQVTGTFEEYGKTYPLTGSLEGQAVTFNVPFGGPRPYTIEFKGTIDHKKKMMTGSSGLKGGGRVFLGHANEIQEPERPWLATKGLKHPLDHTGKPPKDDDD